MSHRHDPNLKRKRVIHKPVAPQRTVRVSVLDLLEVLPDGTHVFSGRPVYGTVTMRRDLIIYIADEPGDTQISFGEMLRREYRFALPPAAQRRIAEFDRGPRP
jgi:hypothetical protein